MKKILIAFFLLLCCATLASAQTAPPLATNTFSMTGQPVALPAGGSTVAGSISGLTFSPTPNFDLREDNLVVATPAAQGTSLGFFGGFNYRVLDLSKYLNNVSPNLNGYRFNFYVTASAGVDRITDAAGNTRQHYAFLGGGGISYDLNQSGSWQMGVEIRYAKLPGIANNTAIVSLGPSFHF